jgi:RNA polymerase sigma factor (sigma-70 family)
MTKRDVINIPPVSEEERKEIMLEAEKPELEKLHDSPDLIIFNNSMICPHPTGGKRVFTDIENDEILDDEDNEDDDGNQIFLEEKPKLSFNEMISILSDREKRVIRLSFEYGYTEREIAKIMRVHYSTINRIKQKALKTIKEYIE